MTDSDDLTQAVIDMNINTSEEPTIWLEFQNPSKDGERIRLHAPFLLSNWQCLFGRGCPGIKFDDKPLPGMDVGCCSEGVYLTGEEDYENVMRNTALLTEEDLHKPALDYIRKHGPLNVYRTRQPDDDPDDDLAVSAKTRVRDGACVFVNRISDAAPGDEGRIGCAFLHLAARLNRESVDAVDHTETMPHTCWQLPFKTDWLYEDASHNVTHIIYPWDAFEWSTTHDFSGLEYWCVNDSAAYTNSEPLYVSAKAELTKIMGSAEAYAVAAELLGAWEKANVVPKVPAAGPNGRTLIPLVVENDKNKER